MITSDPPTHRLIRHAVVIIVGPGAEAARPGGQGGGAVLKQHAILHRQQGPHPGAILEQRAILSTLSQQWQGER